MMGGPESAVSVSDLNRSLKRLIEDGFPAIWLRGEISNLRRQPSGHCYFSLKDEGSQLSAVLFRGNALRAECEPANGKQVLAFGELSVYEPRGTYQIIIRELIEDGIGRLQREFERLKEKMREEGLFEDSRKKALPTLPLTVGVITSPSGAAIRDMISVFQRMNWKGSLRIFPATVQGAAAIPGLLRQVERAGRMKDLDVLVVARGGGSLEDLWCFNDESLARALADCPIPTISAIGHETDVVLTDFVADLRKETPTGAAEWISSVVQAVVRDLREAGEDLIRAGREGLRNRLQELEQIRTRTTARPFLRQIEGNVQRLDEIQNRILRTVEQSFANEWNRTRQIRERLLLRNPVRLLKNKEADFEALRKRIGQVVDRRFREKKDRLEHLLPALRSGGLDQSLRRGFSVVRDSDGNPKTRATNWKEGESLRIDFYDGQVEATVDRVTKKDRKENGN